jgi:hypothetical protein
MRWVACGDELWRSEQAARSSSSGISMNKGLSRCITLLWRSEAALPLLAGRGGEGRGAVAPKAAAGRFPWPARAMRGGGRSTVASFTYAATSWGYRCGGCGLGRWNSILISSASCLGGEGRGGGGVVASSRWCQLLLRWYYVDELI